VFYEYGPRIPETHVLYFELKPTWFESWPFLLRHADIGVLGSGVGKQVAGGLGASPAVEVRELVAGHRACTANPHLFNAAVGVRGYTGLFVGFVRDYSVKSKIKLAGYKFRADANS